MFFLALTWLCNIIIIGALCKARVHVHTYAYKSFVFTLIGITHIPPGWHIQPYFYRGVGRHKQWENILFYGFITKYSFICHITRYSLTYYGWHFFLIFSNRGSLTWSMCNTSTMVLSSNFFGERNDIFFLKKWTTLVSKYDCLQLFSGKKTTATNPPPPPRFQIFINTLSHLINGQILGLKAKYDRNSLINWCR